MIRKEGSRLLVGNGDIYVDVRRDDGDSLIGSHMRKPKFLSNGLVLKSARINVQHNTTPAVFFPGVDPQRTFTSSVPVPEVAVDNEPEVIYEQPTFVQVRKETAQDIFADMGLIADDDDAVESEIIEDDIETVSNADANKPNIADPEDVFEILSSKDIRNFGLTKEDLSALKLTKRQVRELYQNVSGKNGANQESSNLRKEIRKIADQSFQNYKRVMTEIKRIRTAT